MDSCLVAAHCRNEKQWTACGQRVNVKDCRDYRPLQKQVICSPQVSAADRLRVTELDYNYPSPTKMDSVFRVTVFWSKVL